MSETPHFDPDAETREMVFSNDTAAIAYELALRALQNGDPCPKLPLVADEKGQIHELVEEEIRDR